MKKLFYRSTVILGVTTLIFIGCKKDNNTTKLDDLTSEIESYQSAENVSDDFSAISNVATDLPNLFNAVASSNPSTFGVLPDANTTSGLKNSCAVVSVSGTSFPKTVTFDFGTGCVTDNITRKGKIIAVYSAKFKTVGAVTSITYNDYYVNNNKVEGTKTITNNGKNAAGNYTFTTAVNKTKTTSTAGVATYNATKTIEWIAGESTTTSDDDEFAITGIASGTNIKGINYTVEITKPLIKKNNCKFIVAGTTVIKTGDKTKTLDYGNGACDATATVTVNGVTKTITKKK